MPVRSLRSAFVSLRSAEPWPLAVLLTGCQPLAAPPRHDPHPPAAPLPTTTAPTILSAHLARVDDPELGGKDGLLVVLDAELDAASLQPRAFVVSRATLPRGPSRRSWPRPARTTRTARCS
jgi:hypothetical protein